MEKALIDLIGASPVAVALLICVVVFVRFLQGERENRTEMMRECHQSHTAALQQSTEIAKECRDIIRECASSHGAVAEALREISRSKP